MATAGHSPLLLSLHAQTKLGLAKDLKNGINSNQWRTTQGLQMP